MKKNKKKTNKLIRAGKPIIFVVLIIFIFTTELYNKHEKKAIRLDLKEIVISEPVIDEQDLKRIEEIRSALADEYKPQAVESIEETIVNTRKIIFSHYSKDDGSGVGSVGAYGIGIKDFTINDQGWYLYDDKVALACSHESMGDIREGYRYWNKFEEVSFSFDDRIYVGVCVDKGSAMQGWGNETEQRIDIWIENNSNGFGLRGGKVYE